MRQNVRNVCPSPPPFGPVCLKYVRVSKEGVKSQVTGCYKCVTMCSVFYMRNSGRQFCHNVLQCVTYMSQICHSHSMTKLKVCASLHILNEKQLHKCITVRHKCVTECHKCVTVYHKCVTVCHNIFTLCHKCFTVFHKCATVCHKCVIVCHRCSTSCHKCVTVCHKCVTVCCKCRTVCHKSVVVCQMRQSLSQMSHSVS
jgi:hypothetical protein